MPRSKSLRSAIVILSLAAVSGVFALYRQWHLDRWEAVVVRFDPVKPAVTSDLGLLLRRDVYRLQACCPHSTAVLDKFQGSAGPVRMFEVRNTDTHVHGAWRSEIRLRPSYNHRSHWYRARLFVPSDWIESSTPVVVVQWLGTRDILIGDPGSVPPLSLEIVGNTWRLWRASNSHWISPATAPYVEHHTVAASVPLVTGRWVQWTFHVHWSPDGDGRLRAWMDEAKIVDLNGPIGHRDLIGPYLKAGIYIPGWKEDGLEPAIASRQLYVELLAIAARREDLPETPATQAARQAH